MKVEKKEYTAVGEEVYFTKLSNGLTVYLIPKKDYFESYGMITTHFGSIDTRVNIGGKQLIFPPGIAHFLEHKLFEDEKGEDFLEKFVRLGAESNAFTSFTKTSYLFSTTSLVRENLQLLLEMVSQANFTETSVQNEHDIIQQEIEMYQDSPDYQLFFGALANLYPNTPLSEDIAGNKESLRQINVENLYKNFELFYRPQNMNLVVIGNFDLDVVTEYLDSIQSPVIPSSHDFERVTIDHYPVIANQTIRMEVASPKLAVGIRGNDFVPEEERFRYKLILKLLFSMMFGWTSKRFQTLYQSGKIDNSLTLEVEVEEGFHFVMLTMDTQEPVTLSHQFRMALKQFEKDTDISQEHLDTIKGEMFGDFLHGLNSIEYSATQFEAFSSGETSFDLPKILQEISLQDVVKLGHQFIDNADMVDFTIFPK